MVSLLKSQAAAAAIAVAALLPTPSYAIFGDDEARKAILDLREQVRVLEQANTTTTSNTLKQVEKNDALLQEIAKLRGQVEVLTHEVTALQQRQKDFYLDLDTRLTKLEPLQVTIDGKVYPVLPAEKQSYDNALQQFKDSKYQEAGTALSGFLRLYPYSGYAPAAQFWLGSSWYALGNCKNTIAAHHDLVSKYADSSQVPEAMLSIANCQIELKDKPAARKTLQALTKSYAKSPAAAKAKELMPLTK